MNMYLIQLKRIKLNFENRMPSYTQDSIEIKKRKYARFSAGGALIIPKYQIQNLPLVT